MWTGKLKVIGEGGEELDITEELSRGEQEQLDTIVQAVYQRFWNRKSETKFVPTPKYNAEIQRDGDKCTEFNFEECYWTGLSLVYKMVSC